MDPSVEPDQKQFKGSINPKREASEAKRLAALDNKYQQEQKEKQLIKNALTGHPVNKKIIFDESLIKASAKNKESNAVKSLFDDEDDNYDQEDNVDLDISNKPLSNKKEVKLIKLQSKFAHDPRFKVDERFLDDEDAEEENEHSQTGKSLDILEEVLGKPLKRTLKDEDKRQSSVILPRYDPTKPESQKFRIRKVIKLEPHQLAPPGQEKEEEEKPEVSKKRFYEISESFKKEVSDQSDGQSFSLTKLFGRQDIEEPQEEPSSKEDKDDDADTDDSDDNVKRKPVKKAKIMDNLKENKSKGDLSKSLDKKKESNNSRVGKDQSGNKEETSKTGKSKKQGKITNPLLKYERFTLTDDDPRLNEEPFFKPELVKAHFETWKEKRLKMSTALTKRRRHVKHVQKLKTALETKSWDSTDKRQKKIHRVLKKSLKKH